VSYAEYPRMFSDPIPWRMRSLQKLQKLDPGEVASE